MPAELTVMVGLICTLIGALIGISGYRRNVHKDGKQDGMILAEISYVKSGIDDIKAEQREQRELHSKLTERIAKVEASAASAHKRLDDRGVGKS